MALMLLPLLFGFSHCQSILKEPRKIILNDHHSTNITVEYCPFELISNNISYINMTAHCFCIHNENTNESDCSIPGPTLVMHNGTNALLKITNNLYGKRNVCQSPDTCQHFNSFTDLDIINIHTHGLHVSPQIDNPFDINILPTFNNKTGTSHIYNYSIISQHYPGTHYWHTHKHGSSTFHLNAGLFGALLVEHTPSNKYDIDNIKENILMFSWIRATSKHVCSSCQSNDINMLMNSMHMHDDNELHSLCDLYCLYPEIEREHSGVSYDMQTVFDDINLFLVNGQFQPIINDMYVNRFRRLRLINAMGSFYIQYKFPSAACEWYQIAADGIFFDEILDLSINTHLNELILPMGSRADILVKCNTAGIYKIYASENNQQSTDQLSNLQRVINGTVLFSIQVNEYDSHNLDQSNNIISLPSQDSYPMKPYYLSNHFDNVFNACLCHNSYDDLIDNLLGDKGLCFVQMHHIHNEKHQMKHAINGLTFDPNIPLTYLKANSQFEFTFFPTEGHVFHQHAFPFQIQSNVGNSFIAKQYEWRDTIGNWNQSWKYRFYTYDFTGRILLHCHKSWDADVGMVAYYMIKNDVDENKCHLFAKQNNDKLRMNSLWIEVSFDSFTLINLFVIVCLILLINVVLCMYFNKRKQTQYL
eukprot:478919_1